MAENTIIHEISLAGYKATSTGGMLDLGTWGSYGIEKLHLTLDAAWQDLTITAFFNVNGEVVAKRVVGKDGYADVPWEATKENTFSGCLAFEGSINGQRRGDAVFQRHCAIQHCKVEINHRRTILCVASTPNP